MENQLDRELFTKLYIFRETKKQLERESQGRAPVICSDSALVSIVKLKPKKIDDLRSIPEIGTQFIEKYGEMFLQLIIEHENKDAPSALEISPDVHHSLTEFEKKLVNINKRNKLLYVAKLNQFMYDLSLQFTEKDIIDLLFPTSTNSKKMICDGSVVGSDKEYNKFVKIIREVDSELRDSGEKNCYIGYPFVIGKLMGEDFNVRAPLTLFPINIKREMQKIYISLDTTSTVLFNNTLILAHYKFNNINDVLPENNLELPLSSFSSFIETTIEFYKKQGINIQYDNTITQDPILSTFNNYKGEDFPQYECGYLQLEPVMVLGKFPIYSNAIQQDLRKILKDNIINPILNKLLENLDNDELSASVYSGSDYEEEDSPLLLSEQSLTYINSLNSSQENVLSEIQKSDALVIQGPPGTGKSQTIVSLIAQAIGNNQNVLMVSEKKTALDVIHSKLGSLSKYALLIDETGNKELFYSQLKNIIANTGEERYDGELLESLSHEIDGNLERLESIAEKLYKINGFGIAAYKLYNIQETASHTELIPSIINNRNYNLLQLNYNELVELYNRFNNKTLLSNALKYTNINSKFYWLKKLSSTLTDYEIVVIKDIFLSLSDKILDWKSKNFIKKLFSKHKISKEINIVLNEYFNNDYNDIYNMLFESPKSIYESLEYYSEHAELSPMYARLSETEKSYFAFLKDIHYLYDEEPTLIRINQLTFESLQIIHRQKFEAENRDVFQEINSFDSIIEDIDKAIQEKRNISYNLVYNGLVSNIRKYVVNSKRYSDMIRLIESKRKPSVNRFIEKFNFEIMNGVRIWLLTPEVVSEIMQLATESFDLVIFDEASQLYIERTLPTIYRAKKLVVSGDHKQLRPSNLGAGRIDESDLDDEESISDVESLLDLARYRYTSIPLEYHYRSKYEELIAFSNYAFYNGKLYVSPNVDSNDVQPITVHKIENANWINRTNRKEAEYVIQLLKKTLKERKHEETIGIITFNSSQRDLINDLIDEECSKDKEFAINVRMEIERRDDGQDIGLFIKNIERVQGDERDIIIFSIGYGKDERGRLIRQFGWLSQSGGENRLNVAISRAKKKVELVISFMPSELQVEDSKNDGPRYLKKYLEYCFAIHNKDTTLAKQILHSFGDTISTQKEISFDSDFENQVYDALTSEGYDIESQVGIGGYRIDLAVRYQNKYLLGIECDGKLYHSSKSARERDYHRQKYLEERGWKIHRVWSTNWWKNSNREVKKIVAIVEALKIES